MTLIVLNKQQGTFFCYSDSLVAIPDTLGLTRYCKVLTLTIKYRNSTSGVTSHRSHTIGMAISGNLAAATSVYTILSGSLQSLHSHETDEPPEPDDIINFALRVANEVFDEIRPLGEKACFGFFLFGFDISLRKPFSVVIGCIQDSSGIWQVQRQQLETNDNTVYAIGTGSLAFYATLRKQDPNDIDIPKLVYEFIKSKQVSSVGGMPQLLIVSPTDVTIEPVVVGSDDGSRATLYHSGVNVDGYNTVGKYGFGLHVHGFNMDPVITYEALTRAGFDPKDRNLTVGEVNRAKVEFELKICSDRGGSLPYIGTISIQGPIAVSGSKYLFGRCSSCRRLTPVLSDTRSRPIPLFDQSLVLEFECVHCESRNSAKANSLVSKVQR